MRQKVWLTAICAILAIPAMAGAQQSVQSSSQSTQTSQSPDKKTTAAPATQTATVTATKTESLAEAARKARAAEKTAPKATVVFTNDNIPTASNSVSVVGQAAAASSSTETTNGASSTTPAAAGDEAAWRQKFADARHKIEQDKQELAIMQRELGELNLQYYPNPSQALMQSINRTDIIKKQAAIDAKQKELATDEQALSDLQSELRKEGGDPGWARE